MKTERSESVNGRSTLKYSTYEFIKNKIICCEYEPGTFLNEEILCEETGVSRTPVRDALGRLEQEGLVKILPKKGVMISNLSINDMNMTYEFRLLLEPYILKNYGNTLDTNETLRYYQLFSDTKLLEDKSLSATSDDDFHMWIVNACPNTYFKNSYIAIHNQNLRYRTLSGIRSREKAADEQTDHLTILSECLKGNWNEAAEAMRRHILNSKETSFRLLFSQNLGGTL